MVFVDVHERGRLLRHTILSLAVRVKHYTSTVWGVVCLVQREQLGVRRSQDRALMWSVGD